MLWMMAGCHGASSSSAASACEELQGMVPSGVVLATDDQRCSEILTFGLAASERYGMPFKEWLTTVPAQGMAFALDAIYALTERQTLLGALVLSPEKVPCGRGVPIGDDEWSRSQLSKIITTRPLEFYVSLSVDIGPDNVASIRVFQDFDCDQRLGLLEIVGRFKPGLSPFTGGWQLIRSSESKIDE